MIGETYRWEGEDCRVTYDEMVSIPRTDRTKPSLQFRVVGITPVRLLPVRKVSEEE